MTNPVFVDFVVRGIPDVSRAFRTVQDVVTRSEGAMNRAVMGGARLKERQFQMVAKEAARWQKEAARGAEKAAKDEVRAVERGAREKVRAFVSADREIARARQTGVRAAEAAARAEARAFERGEAEKNRSAMKWLRTREAEQGKARSRFADAVVGGGAKGVRGMANGVVGGARAVLNVAGGFSVQDSMTREIGLRGQAATLAASTSLAGGQQFTSSEILGKARQVGTEAGFDPSEIMGAIGNMKDLTGDMKQAMAMSSHLAKYANATGTEVGSLGSLAGNIAASSPGMGQDDILKLMRVLSKQGAEGAVEIKDFSKYGSRLTAGASLFGGDRATNIASMGAFAQVARQHGGAASPAEAALAAQRFATDVQKHSGDLEKQGIAVKDGKGGMRDPREIMKAMLAKSGDDVTKLGKFGLGERSIRVLTGFSDIARSAGGGKSGKDAVDRELNKYTAGVSDEAVEAAAKTRMGEVDKTLLVQMNNLRDAVGTQLVPELGKFVTVLTDHIPEIKRLLEAFTGLAKWALENPLQAAFLGLAGSIAKSVGEQIVAAKIGDVMKTKLGENLGSAGLIIGLATIAIAEGKVAIDKEFKDGDKRRERSWADASDATAVAARIRGGTATPEDRAKAAALTSKLQGDIEGAKNEQANPGFWKNESQNIATSPAVRLFTDAGTKAKEEDAAQYDREKGQLAKALSDLQIAIKENTTATSVNSSKTSASGDSPARTPQQVLSIVDRQGVRPNK